MRHPKTRVSLIAASIAATLSVSAPVHVHAAEKALEEVIVTARKRDENLQQVPTAINVLTASALEDRQIVTITDLERTSPNVTMTETSGAQAGALQVFMRGIGNDNGFDPGIGLYIDDVFIQRPQGSMLDLYDVERIEVLKGPQGNLYGRNTIGGAIKYITKEPNETPEANVEGKIGSYNLRQVKASASGQLADKVFGGIGLMHRQRDGIQTNDYSGEKMWDANVYGLRGNLKFIPTDSLTIRFGADYMHDNSTPRLPKLIAANQDALNGMYDFALGTGNLPTDAPRPDFSGLTTGKDRVNSEQDYDVYRLQTFTTYLSVTWDLNEQWSFKSVTAERKMAQTFRSDFDGSSLKYYSPALGRDVGAYLTNTQWVYADDLSQEFQLNYSGDDLDAVAGIFYTDGRQQSPSYGTIDTYVNIVENRITDTYKATNQLKSWSVYGNVDYNLTEDWHLSLGARFTNDKKTFEQKSNVSYISGGGAHDFCIDATTCFPLHPSIADNFGPESKTWSNFSPSAKLAYDFNENTMGYLSIATGFKSGGFNSFPNGSPAKTFNPEKVRTLAAGLKTTLLDGKLRINTEAFYNDYTDKQLQYISSVNGNVVTLYTNAGKARTQGIETEISWLTPISGLQFDLNVGYLESTVKKFERLVNGDTIDLASHTSLGFAPRWTVQPRISYSMAVADLGDLMLAADASYRSKSYTNSPVDRADATGLSQTQVQDEHAIYNANVVFNTADNHWRFALEGKNLSNRRVLTNTFNLELGSPAFVMGGYNDPRTWAFSAAYKY